MEKRKPYTKRADLPADEIVARYRAGETLKQIAAAYGSSDNTVKRLLQQQGAQLRTARQAAKLNERSDPEREARDGEIIDLYGEGASTVTLSKRYGLSTSAVRSILLRNGVTMRTRSAAANSDQPSLPRSPDSALPSEKVIAEYESGTSVSTLAMAYGVSDVTVLGLLRRHGVKLRTSQNLPAEEVITRYRQGDSLAILAQHYGVSVKTIQRLMKAHGVERRSSAPQAGVPRVVSAETEAKIVQRNRAGESLRSIATSLGISRSAVKSVLDRRCVAPSGPKRGPRPDLPMEEIAKRRASGDTAEQLAADFGVSAATIRRRLQGMR